MPSFLAGMQNGLGTLVGGPGNAGAAASNAWNYGQYSPFTVNNPMGNVGFNGTTATGSLSPFQSGIQGGLGTMFNQGAGLAGGYNPNTSFLPQQYQQIFGDMNGNANSMFNSLQSAQAPWMAQQRASNLDSQFGKGTLASTAGSYQTAGLDMAQNSQMNQNMAQSQQYALGRANSQFGAAQGVAGLGQEQQQFGAQQGLGMVGSAMSGLGNQNSQMLQMLGLGGNLGAQRSGANVAAATPGIETGNIQDNATAGLLSGLLFGGGSQGGLLQSLLGTGGGGGGLLKGLGGIGSAIGGGLGKLFGGGGGSNGSSGGGVAGNVWSNGTGNQWAGDTQGTWNADPGINAGQTPTVTNGDSGTTTWWGDSFNGAGGQATNPALQNIGVSPISENASARNAINGAQSGGRGFGLGDLSSVGNAIQGVMSGTPTGYLGATANLGSLAGRITGNKGLSSMAGSLGGVLNMYNGIRSGEPLGYASALGSGASLAASSGAAAAAGAGAGTLGALAAAGTGVGAIAAIPAVVGGVTDLIAGIGSAPGKTNMELGLLRNNTATSGVIEKFGGGITGGSFGLGDTPQDWYNGKDITNKLEIPANVQRASELFRSGNMAAYKQFMDSLSG